MDIGHKPTAYWAIKFSLGVAAMVGLFFIAAVRTAAPAADSTIVIKMLDMPPAFQPSLVTIKTGQTVEWENVGNEVHHATSDPSLAIKSKEVANPTGAEPFDSGFLRPGETFSHTFTIPGKYKYACVVHEAKGMVGEIVVIK
jgi:plastocyanin